MFTGLMIVLLVYGMVSCSTTEKTPPLTPEQIQEIKKDKANKKGQVFHEFLRGAAGQEKSK